MRYLSFFLIICSLIIFFACSKDSDINKNEEESPVDNEAPSKPLGVSLSSVTANTASISWEQSSDNIGVEGYSIYKEGLLVESVNETSYTAVGLNPNSIYVFAITAFDAAANESESSESLEVITEEESTADLVAPSKPEGLKESNLTGTSVDISWNASTDNRGVAGYKIFQNGTLIGATDKIEYSINGLTPNTSYTFSVLAYDEAGNESDLSEEVIITTESAQGSVKVLVFTKTDGYDHNTRNETIEMVQGIATNLGFEVVVDNTGNEFNSLSNLSQYKVIFFSNTSGNTLNDGQRGNVEAYANQGGNFISNHAASDSYGHSTANTVSGNGKGLWDWYAENVTGCSVRNNPNHTSSGLAATVSVENQNNELTDGIGFPWNDNEEWYYWEGGYVNPLFIELLRVSDTGSNSYDDTRMTAQYLERADDGKSFYTSMGHSKGKYSDAEFVQLITNVFVWMLN
ncbi:chitodextrinase/type 1 glutamine amidotransferase [Saonia flava]|uniref:Chitodextrinase/type 1 glutamine amidotransferase n=2 Tax=Saonia flava TaxID=523696 RepID=A0A846R2N3_9FLAO|nr:chitodextrinase/type 1 glutamine amidotransferase [Saonia flava]